MARAPFEIAGIQVQPGTRKTIEVQVAKLYTHTPLHIPVEIVHGRRDGPVLMVCGAIHGDEINGVEIVRRVLTNTALRTLRGTLVAVPIVNIFGFVQRTRYLPDRRDLNRCFPGSESGSLGGRIAYLLRTQIMEHVTHIIDLHTGAIHRFNLPQIRAELKTPETARMAEAFAAPVIIDAGLREGSLRAYADSQNIPVITYEGGEALRFDEVVIASGVKGVMRVMRELEMTPAKKSVKPPRKRSEIAASSQWVRADIDGIMRPVAKLGQKIIKGQKLAMVADPFGASETAIISPCSGIVICVNNLPLVNEGEAIYHIARFDELGEAEKAMDYFRDSMESEVSEAVLPVHPWDELQKQ
ncbi:MULTISPECIES: succinylglutamate desuccinylase/aspartoacylase family protein [unclassified Marinobacter]|uniref:succinylglutamate desuccinylase/aspartoacylase family protein n=1 Tax=unclassified Marinobacter TaxID=83889 RepID=UPI00200C5CDF|nr:MULTISPECIES: succinylglutamate desuccinylase/aspartoacylase family protein [unclassified Marinobacter]UQG56986.1 succinylglutamate desuccinylase/aspartoacylase family protein [Marinobacter sp. M4C]UQG65790.1 succinylglutamate desuccinylase/aspartoacylase family protein [Marinobacter sp. M2C]UQG70070.1 succinylglutamate desuccinylase/aspartoacylase family protein [Marinobacter sp. M1C]